MKQMTSGEFRRRYASEPEAVEVTAYDKVIGVWIPAGSELSEMSEMSAEVAEPERRMTIRPVKARMGPALVASSKTVFDITELRTSERAKFAQQPSRSRPRP